MDGNISDLQTGYCNVHVNVFDICDAHTEREREREREREIFVVYNQILQVQMNVLHINKRLLHKQKTDIHTGILEENKNRC